MDFGRLEDFNLHVDPYKVLGVPRGCRDIKQIKHAYHKKSLQLHPDKRRGDEYDFSTLNKCYIYLKTLCQEIHQTDETYKINLEDRMRDLQQVRLDSEQIYHKKRLDSQVNRKKPTNFDFS